MYFLSMDDQSVLDKNWRAEILFLVETIDLMSLLILRTIPVLNNTTQQSKITRIEEQRKVVGNGINCFTGKCIYFMMRWKWRLPANISSQWIMKSDQEESVNTDCQGWTHSRTLSFHLSTYHCCCQTHKLNSGSKLKFLSLRKRNINNKYK